MMEERVTNAIAAVQTYRGNYPDDAKVEAILTQLERIQRTMQIKEPLTYREKDEFTFHLVEGSPIEADESLSNELYSIRNFVMNGL